MAKHTFITYTEATKNIANKICDDVFINSRIIVESYHLSTDDILKMAKRSTTDYFFVVCAERYEDFSEFNFSFAPAAGDDNFIHIWDRKTNLRMYKKDQVMLNPELYNDNNLTFEKIRSKVPANKVYKDLPYDIVFISYDEQLAESNYNSLTSRFPRAKRVNGVKGILNAHMSAAKIADTKMFYAVDADAIVNDAFNFDFVPDKTDAVYVWRSINPINKLTYGYGGIKLFPTISVLEYNKSPIDFTTSVSTNFIPIGDISNITKFNTDPFSTWRSAFRECTKLSSKLINNQHNDETEYRLNMWCTEGIGEDFGEYAIAGAIAGKEYGIENRNNSHALSMINDYEWLKDKFQQCAPK